MSDVRDAAAPTTGAANDTGGFIWYELMTTDAAAAKKFYDPVVGGSIGNEQGAPGVDYRMINRTDGGMAGGILQLTQENLDGGARPLWIGYLHTDDVDAKVE